ncbi:MAG: hypothetical protein ABJL67_13595 [Sulfitobacter sp.]
MLTFTTLTEFMLRTLSLILPVLMPSWRFFEAIQPSPRVQWQLTLGTENASEAWHDFRPRPKSITPLQMFLRLFWNPLWNETLFVVSCAERIAQHPTPHSIHEINQRILSDIKQRRVDTAGKMLRFRLVFVYREKAKIMRDVLFLSEAVAASGYLKQ